jgi:hypothetical protein
MSVWVRRLVTLACVLAAWLVVRPAAASAPLCDDRGASMLAPMPVLDMPDASVDVGDHDGGCEGWVGRDHAYQRGERPARGFSPARGDVLPTSVIHVPSPDARASAQAPAARETVPAGVRFPLERPPRA